MKNIAKSLLNSTFCHRKVNCRGRIRLSSLFSDRDSAFSLSSSLFVCVEKENDQAIQSLLLTSTAYSKLFVAHNVAVCRGKTLLLQLHRPLGMSEAKSLKGLVCTLVFHPFVHLLETYKILVFIHKRSFPSSLKHICLREIHH